MNFAAIITAIASAFSMPVRQLAIGSADPIGPLPQTHRTVFSPEGCTIYGYPSTGGVLIKSAEVLDMIYLSLPPNNALERSREATEEDEFCDRLRRVGATWWPHEEAWLDYTVYRKIDFDDDEESDTTDEQRKVLVFGWPADGVGVWVLRYAEKSLAPRGFGKVKMASSMEEKIEALQELGAEFVPDVGDVKELRDEYLPRYEDRGERRRYYTWKNDNTLVIS